MHFLISLIVVAGVVFVVCLGLVKLSWEFSQASVHQSPAFLETHSDPGSAEEPARAIESNEPSRSELRAAR